MKRVIVQVEKENPDPVSEAAEEEDRNKKD